MALIRCPECEKEISQDALQCPNCGKPNKKMRNIKRTNYQSGGCLMFVVGAMLCIVSPFFGGLVAVVGLVFLLIGFFI